VTAESSDRTTLLLEIDATSSRAALDESGLGHEITEALRASGLPTTITINSIGDHQQPETRDVTAGLTLAAVVIYQLRIYLPNALTEFMVKKAVDELDRRIRSWRRRTGNTRLEVPIYGPDGKTVIHIVERDEDPAP
jgi:hypothetical protein